MTKHPKRENRLGCILNGMGGDPPLTKRDFGAIIRSNQIGQFVTILSVNKTRGA